MLRALNSEKLKELALGFTGETSFSSRDFLNVINSIKLFSNLEVLVIRDCYVSNWNEVIKDEFMEMLLKLYNLADARIWIASKFSLNDQFEVDSKLSSIPTLKKKLKSFSFYLFGEKTYFYIYYRYDTPQVHSLT